MQCLMRVQQQPAANKSCQSVKFG